MGAEQSQLEELKSSDYRQGSITFFVNGKEYNVQTDACDPEIGPQYLLVDYLRDKLGLTGTKYMCREGGCGSCMVTVKSTHPVSGKEIVGSANSCLLPLFACDGLDITTIEGLGNRQVGYDRIQQRLVQFGGTQCGFCTPGFVMTQYSLQQGNPRFTTADVEYSADGNICRCTGYRPIIEAFKSLSVNPSEDIKRKCNDIEEAHLCPLKSTIKANEGNEQLEIIQLPRKLHLQGRTGEQWFKTTSLTTLFDILQRFISSQVRYRLVAGNTGTGVYKNDGPYQGFIEINDVMELHYTSLDQNGIVLGGGVTLTAAIDMFERASKVEGFVYAREFYDHFRRVAALSIRNRGTLAGNVMLKHMHREFSSDIFLLFESIGTVVMIGSSPKLQREYTMLEFLDVDMTGKVILSFHLPIYTGNYFYKCFRLGRRYQNTSSHVNAGFLFNIEPRKLTILDRPSIVYGGINPNFVHAHRTEDFLVGKQLNVATLQGALLSLQREILPVAIPELTSPEYRLGLAQSYLYRCFLGIRGKSANARLRSGASDVERGNNKGKQTFDSDRTQWPLYQPIPKLESFPQTSGEAQFINDIHPQIGELFGVFVLTTVANATIKFVDASEALMTPGVIAFITAKDIPGNNNYAVFLTQPEEIFVESQVRHAGQAVGLLLATDKYTAFGARSKVIVKYENIKKPVLDIRESIKLKEESKVEDTEELNLAFPCRGINAQTANQLMLNIKKGLDPVDKSELQGNLHNVKGTFRTHPQYHFHMETQICICVPNEDGMDVYASTQHMDSTQVAIAGALNVPNNSITVHVRRLGGAFGAKISQQNGVAAACAIAAHVTHRPVRVALDLETNMRMIGKRLPYFVRYEANVDDNGKIYKLDADIYCDTGSVAGEPTSLYAMLCFQSGYRGNGWQIQPRSSLTDVTPHTYCRSPGSAQGVAAIENIMEHIAYTVKKDPLDVRVINFMKKGDPFIGVPGAKLPLDNLLPGMLAELKVNGDYEARRNFIDSYNQSNRWKKRGIAIVPQRYPNYYAVVAFPTFISVCHVDGTVNVSHGGIEMGQGINTKAAQVVAHTLQIPLDKVKVKPSNTIISPNSGITGASVGSELVCYSALRACELLLEKLEPLRKQLGNPTWEALITAANAGEILLTSQFQPIQGDIVSYDVWGVLMTEVEIDVLTGDIKIIRADLIEDAGNSLSPLVDIGQVEGGLVMGLGWWLSEELIYDQESGEVLTDRSWNYKPMLAADIPEDLRVTLLRNAPNPYGVLSSKATGEPPFNMACCVLFAIRNAIDSARRELGNYSWYQLEGAVTRETIRTLCLTSAEQFTF